MKTMLCPGCWGVSKSCAVCNNTRKVVDEPLAPNFMLSECLRSPLAVRYGLSNAPTREIVDHLTAVCTHMAQPLRDARGAIQITSGYRSLPLNAMLSGASTTSAHPEGNALDLVPLHCSLREAFDWLADPANGISFDQLIYEGTWLHLGWRKNGVQPRGQKLQMFDGHYSVFDPNDARCSS